jgi:hypothetical protein
MQTCRISADGRDKLVLSMPKCFFDTKCFLIPSALAEMAIRDIDRTIRPLVRQLEKASNSEPTDNTLLASQQTLAVTGLLLDTSST